MVKGIAVLFEYETPKLVQISNIRIGVTQRLLQLVILIYVVCWVMIYEKGYQENDIAKSAVTTKVKGVGFTNFSHIPGIGIRSWDVADYIVPPLENNALFVITNLVKTERQSLSKCPESSWVPEAACYKDSDCKPYFITHLGNGAHTGKCIIKPGNDIGSCEIYSWCPLENDTLPLGKKSYLFPMVYNYTLLIKNDINFEKFGIHRRNIQNWASKKFLRTCLYNKTDPENRFCPIFQFGTIFEEANVDQSIFISQVSFLRDGVANPSPLSGVGTGGSPRRFPGGVMNRLLFKCIIIRFQYIFVFSYYYLVELYTFISTM
ncbi:P2X purinoceptor 4 [Schistosoma haematobium]|uniref:P2X purinoceptor 4 n=1 Tax=Schistosoma haematobium TaxID=6185 RepID=A0A922LL31_SCHHA|nr:P2X purinoceptor 4 [Schistosoma haematobium]KAH9588273.1 P2X purinoceptor 4 [Schistosoma haematobium]CAH8562070.1 unnamed protein product [Schistosoma haematobium]CAH8566733.1 unnamed protein product [Schistosoma haematobium]